MRYVYFYNLTGYVTVPEWTQDNNTAKNWIKLGYWVVCRELVTSKDGKGISLAKTEEELKPSKVYTKFIHAQREYRAYVFGHNLIDFVEKRKTNKALEDRSVNPDIKTYSGGWCFCRNDIRPPHNIEDLRHEAVGAIKTLGLDFGGVDIIEDRNGKCVVLEVNTAPSIWGETVSRFAEAIKAVNNNAQMSRWL